MMDLRVNAVHSAQMGGESGTLNVQRNESYSTFKMSAGAKARQQQRLRFMRVGQPTNRPVARRLENCDTNHRCKSEADPICVALFQQKLSRAVAPLLLAGHGQE